MAKVKFETTHTTLENDYGREQDGIVVTCSKCGHQVEVFGDDERSIKRGAATLNDECPLEENNFYEEL